MANLVFLRFAPLFLVAGLPLYLVRFRIAGLPTTLLEVLFFAVVGVWALGGGLATFRERVREVFVQRILLAAGLVVMAGFFGVLFAGGSWLDALGIFRAYYFEPFVFLCVLLSSPVRRDEILMALFASGTVVAGWAILQRFGHVSIPDLWAHELRVTGPFPYPNALGLYLAPILALAGVVLTRVETRKVTRWLSSVVLLLGAVAIYWSATEAAWLALVVVGAAYLASMQLWRPAVFAGGVAALVLLLLSPDLRDFLSTKLFLQDFSGAVRRTTWQETGAFLQDSWFTGAGLNQYPSRMIPYHRQLDIEIFQYPHTILLNTWVEVGLPGLLLALSGIFLMLREAWRRSAMLTLVPLAVMLVHGIFDVPFFKNDLAMLTAIVLWFTHYEHAQGHTRD